jgi:hypothetical protein
LAFQVGGVSKIDTIKYGDESGETKPEKDCSGEAQQQLKTTDLSSETSPHVKNP